VLLTNVLTIADCAAIASIYLLIFTMMLWTSKGPT